MVPSPSVPRQVSFEHRMVEAAIDSAVNAIIIIDEQGIIQRVNPATEAIFGFKQVELLGRNINMLMPGHDRKAHDSYLHNYLTTGQKKIIGIGREVVALRKNSTVFPIHLSVGEFKADGKRYFVGTIHDISTRTEAERESARQRTLFEAIFKNCPDAMVISGADDRIMLCNNATARIFGHEEADLIGQSCRIIFENETDYHRITDTASATMPSGHSTGDVIGFVRQGGEIFPGVTGAASIISNSGALMGRLCIIRDVSRELAQEHALRQVQRMEALGQLTGGIAHDFNNLLTIITGNLELLGMEIEDETQSDYLKRANDAALMGARLTDRLLTFARRRPLDAHLMNLNDQLLGLMDMLRRTLGETINLTSSFAPDLWATRSDVSEIENALLNLAINARDAMPSGGQLLIETGNVTIDDPPVSDEIGLPLGDYVRLSVSDTGRGIEPAALSRVFEPFFTTKQAGKGTGLGLSVIYGFAKQSGGRLTIYSEPGRGTTVNLYLPRAEIPAPGQTAKDNISTPASASGEQILVVEDQAPVRDVTKKRLSNLGYKVLEAGDAAAAMEVLTSGAKVDLIFSDVVMPGGMTGFDLMAWVNDNHPGIPVLLTSGFAENIAHSFAQEHNAAPILRKPYSGEDLAAAIRRTLDQREVNRA